MKPEFMGALVAFAFVTSITPGPNNLMLMASGANFGFRRTLPHMMGVGIGFVLMIVLVGAGLAGLFDAYPASYTVLRTISIAYLGFLSWKIATAAPPNGAQEPGSPFTFVQAALFQWVNPKAWAMALTAISVYAQSSAIQAVVIVALVFGAINVPSITCWVVLGQAMRRFLKQKKHLRIFNCAMAGLLIASLLPVIL